MPEVILSIDIGKNNLGFTIVRNAGSFSRSTSLNSLDFEFGLFNLDSTGKKSDDSIVIARTRTLQKWIGETLGSDITNLRAVVIEEQVRTNTIAMGLMYCLCGLFAEHTSLIEVFSPRLKFTKLKQVYDSSGKKHKKLSVANAFSIASQLSIASCERLKSDLESRTKKDDVADSFNQLLVWMIDHEFISTTFSDVQKWLELDKPTVMEEESYL